MWRACRYEDRVAEELHNGDGVHAVDDAQLSQHFHVYVVGLIVYLIAVGSQRLLSLLAQLILCKRSECVLSSFSYTYVFRSARVTRAAL